MIEMEFYEVGMSKEQDINEILAEMGIQKDEAIAIFNKYIPDPSLASILSGTALPAPLEEKHEEG